MSSIDEIARAARDNLQSSLQVTHSLTANPQSASDYLVNRMNGVLRAVVDSNFDSGSLQKVGELYAAIGEVQPQMVANSSELALVNLSRSFAVVMEETIRQKDNNNNNNNVHNNNNNKNNVHNNNNNGAATGLKNIKDNSGFQGQSLDKKMAPVAGSGVEYGAPPKLRVAGGRAAASDGGGFKGFGQCKIAKGSGCVPSPAVAAAHAAKEAKKDYSPEARKGRITIFKIPFTVTELQLTAHFKQIGEIKSTSYPTEKGKRKGFAFIKFESNELADAACQQLNGRELGGTPLLVERAKYWYKRQEAPSEIRDAPAFGTLAGYNKKKNGAHSGRLASTGSSPTDTDTVINEEITASLSDTIDEVD